MDKGKEFNRNTQNMSTNHTLGCQIKLLCYLEIMESSSYSLLSLLECFDCQMQIKWAEPKELTSSSSKFSWESIIPEELLRCTPCSTEPNTLDISEYSLSNSCWREMRRLCSSREQESFWRKSRQRAPRFETCSLIPWASLSVSPGTQLSTLPSRESILDCVSSNSFDSFCIKIEKVTFRLPFCFHFWFYTWGRKRKKEVNRKTNKQTNKQSPSNLPRTQGSVNKMGT